jgi:hypothetical protein
MISAPVARAVSCSWLRDAWPHEACARVGAERRERLAEHPVGAGSLAGRMQRLVAAGASITHRPQNAWGHGGTARGTADSGSIIHWAHQLARSDEPIPVAEPATHPSSGSDTDATPKSTTAPICNLAREHWAINPIDRDRRSRSRVPPVGAQLDETAHVDLTGAAAMKSPTRANQTEAVNHIRHLFQKTWRRTSARAVERRTGCRVLAFIGRNQLEPNNAA